MNGNIDKFENEERKRKHNWFYIALNARYGHSAFRHYNTPLQACLTPRLERS